MSGAHACQTAILVFAELESWPSIAMLSCGRHPLDNRRCASHRRPSSRTKDMSRLRVMHARDMGSTQRHAPKRGSNSQNRRSAAVPLASRSAVVITGRLCDRSCIVSFSSYHGATILRASSRSRCSATSQLPLRAPGLDCLCGPRHRTDSAVDAIEFQSHSNMA